MPEVSQGSSLLATLGFIAESLWDSRSLAAALHMIVADTFNRAR